MLMATAMAIKGSSTNQPVSLTSTMATTIPMDVQTSLSRCCASALSVIERKRRAARSNNQATAPLRAVAIKERVKPRSTELIGSGLSRRPAAAQIIPMAATTMRALSRPLEKYSALEWPKLWLRSAGLEAWPKAQNAVSAATKLTQDSRASESKPTDPVTAQARVFRAMVISAAATDSRA